MKSDITSTLTLNNIMKYWKPMYVRAINLDKFVPTYFHEIHYSYSVSISRELS